MKHDNGKAVLFAVVAVLSASVALAEDFKTVNGKEYKNVTVSRVEPDGIMLRTKSGISKAYFIELPKEVQERFHYNPNPIQVQQKQDQPDVAQHDDPAPAATSPNNVSSEQKQVVDEMLGDLSLAFHRNLSDTEKQGMERIVQQHDAEKMSVREGQILQVMDDGIVLSRCVGSYADGRHGRWLGPIFVSGSFPGAVDGALWEGWIWPAGTYKAGTSTLEHWATSLDLAVKAGFKEAAGQLPQGPVQLRQGTRQHSRPPVSFMQSIGGG